MTAATTAVVPLAAMTAVVPLVVMTDGMIGATGVMTAAMTGTPGDHLLATAVPLPATVVPLAATTTGAASRRRTAAGIGLALGVGAANPRTAIRD